MLIRTAYLVVYQTHIYSTSMETIPFCQTNNKKKKKEDTNDECKEIGDITTSTKNVSYEKLMSINLRIQIK